MEENIDKLLETAAENLYLDLLEIEISTLNISDYNKNYLTKYTSNYSFYISLYSQLLKKAITKLNKPINESTFVDYGGGCGMLSFFAKKCGFKNIIYLDIYSVSVKDSKIIGSALNIKINKYFWGDIDEFVEFLSQKNIKPDLICSFDVLEHIYNLNNWIKTISKIETNFQLLFMTSANSHNPFIRKRLKKLHLKAEHQGFSNSFGWKKSDTKTSYLKLRKNIIEEKYPSLDSQDIEFLSKRTRGLRKEHIYEVVSNFIKSGKINYTIKHPTNTCDPYSGNWTENLIDLHELKKIGTRHNFKTTFTNSFYGFSNNKLLNIPKYCLNLLIKILGSKNLFFSPTYTLELENKI